jgi:NlpC/P60 family
VLSRALRFVGSPYVWAGTSERPQPLFGKTLPGGFDCSGFVWRVYKLQAFTAAPELSRVLMGRTSYAMSGEVDRSARIARGALQPGDVVFFGSRGPLVALRHDAHPDDRVVRHDVRVGPEPPGRSRPRVLNGAAARQSLRPRARSARASGILAMGDSR